MRPFNIIVIGIFAALAIGAVIVFATFSALSSNKIGTVVIWGSLPKDIVTAPLETLKKGNTTYDQVNYVEIAPDQLISKLVEAIAAGRGPDLVVFPAADLIRESDKLTTISYADYSRRDFQNTFVQAGEVFLNVNGLSGIPFTIDPLVLYWNRGLFSSVGISRAPLYWDEITDIAPKITKAEQNGTLTRSAVALGVWDNIPHAKEIYLTLVNQLGNEVVALKEKGGYQSVFESAATDVSNPADSALRFYTDFADPVKPGYSWNSSEPDARDAFVKGTLGMYFGFASELSGIRAANPNLNFDVAPVPQVRGGGSAVASELTALSIPRGSQNPAGALLVAKAMTSADSERTLSLGLHIPSARRDVGGNNPADPYAAMFRNAALVAFSFLDPDPAATDAIFKRMVESVLSGKLQVSEATHNADAELQALFGVQ